MQTKQQIPPKPDRKLDPGLAWHHDQELNEWVIASVPVASAPIQTAEEYFSLPLNSLVKTPSMTVMRMTKETCDRVKHLFSLSNLKEEAVMERHLQDNSVILGLPIGAEDMTILIENEQ